MNKLIKSLAIVFISVFLLQSAMAKIVPALELTIESNESVLNITNAYVVADNLSEPNEFGEHVIKLKNKNEETLYQLRFLAEGFTFPPQGIENLDINIADYLERERKNFSLSYFLPFLKEAEYVVIEGGEGEIARFNLGQLCNSDNSCQKTENHISCPEDCPLNKEDNYCLPLTDNICDPDCSAGIDPDCTEPKPTPEPETSEISPILLIVGAAIIVVIVLMLFKMKK